MNYRGVGAACMQAALAAVLASCDVPLACHEDTNACSGQLNPAPAGVLEGTLTYEGPRPWCVRDASGALVEPIVPVGAVVFFLFDDDMPPPPEGPEDEPIDFLTLPASRLFSRLTAEDCLPTGTKPAVADVMIVRTVNFVWPSIEIEYERELNVRIVGHFDRDESFLPGFAVRAVPTLGDVAGGFIDDAGRPQSIRFAAGRMSPRGLRIDNILLRLNQIVNTAIPVFDVSSGTRPLSSEERLPTNLDDPDPAVRETMLYNQSMLALNLRPSPDEALMRGLDAAGLSLDTSAQTYSWFSQCVDIEDDGTCDFHPILGDDDAQEGLEWRFPIVLASRVRGFEDDKANDEQEPTIEIPDVTLVATVRPVQFALAQAFRPQVQISVPPVAVVDLIPGTDSCRVLYVPPGNWAEVYEEPTDDDVYPICQELPTGRYNVVAFNGVAGGSLREVDLATGESQACVGTTCYLWEGGRRSEQFWMVGNELGESDEIGDASLPPRQGREARFTVHDPNPENDPTCTHAYDPVVGTEREIKFIPIPPACCESVRPLCDLPLCPARELEEDTEAASYFEVSRMHEVGVNIRAVSADDRTDSKNPTCTPFPMPLQCCK